VHGRKARSDSDAGAKDAERLRVHFTVDGALIEAWAPTRISTARGDDRQTPPDDPGKPSIDFHGLIEDFTRAFLTG
jgi:hypothetical protein